MMIASTATITTLHHCQKRSTGNTQVLCIVCYGKTFCINCTQDSLYLGADGSAEGSADGVLVGTEDRESWPKAALDGALEGGVIDLQKDQPLMGFQWELRKGRAGPKQL
jgi:hypothetical protein